MTSKSAFLTALNADVNDRIASVNFTATNAANTFTATAHGFPDEFGPVRLSSTEQLPAELTGQKATVTLTLTPGAIVDDVVQVGHLHYQFAADPTTGTPDGSSGNPFLVDVGADDEESLAHLVLAINDTGVGGTDYSEEISSAHPSVEATASDATTVSLRAKAAGVIGNSLPTVATGDDGLAFGSAFMSGGTDAVDYYLIVVDEDTLQVELSVDGGAVTFTDDGTGTMSIVPTVTSAETFIDTMNSNLADAIATFVNNSLTQPGARVMPYDVNRANFWQALIDGLPS